MNEKQRLKILVILIIILFSTIAKSENKIIIASTTSTYDTGLLNLLNDKFYKKFNIRVQVLSLGTGQAIRTAKEGNTEILLVHHRPSEIEFMNSGYGVERYEIMYNDYVLVGPKIDDGECKSVKQKLEDIQKWLKITEWNHGKPITKNLITRIQNKMITFNVIDEKKNSKGFIKNMYI